MSEEESVQSEDDYAWVFQEGGDGIIEELVNDLEHQQGDDADQNYYHVGHVGPAGQDRQDRQEDDQMDGQEDDQMDQDDPEEDMCEVWVHWKTDQEETLGGSNPYVISAGQQVHSRLFPPQRRQLAEEIVKSANQKLMRAQVSSGKEDSHRITYYTSNSNIHMYMLVVGEEIERTLLRGYDIPMEEIVVEGKYGFHLYNLHYDLVVAEAHRNKLAALHQKNNTECIVKIVTVPKDLIFCQVPPRFVLNPVYPDEDGGAMGAMMSTLGEFLAHMRQQQIGQLIAQLPRIL
jgi:hypothetical protein